MKKKEKEEERKNKKERANCNPDLSDRANTTFLWKGRKKVHGVIAEGGKKKEGGERKGFVGFLKNIPSIIISNGREKKKKRGERKREKKGNRG